MEPDLDSIYENLMRESTKPRKGKNFSFYHYKGRVLCADEETVARMPEAVPFTDEETRKILKQKP